MSDGGNRPVDLADLRDCFEGAIPAAVATASAGGVPNITYLSRVRIVDGERIALSNQFFTKTARNLAENPRASVLVVDPRTFDEFRLTLVYERTDRRGPVFERLRADVDLTAALQGMEDVFRLRAADIYRVVHIERVTGDAARTLAPVRAAIGAGPVAELSARLSRCTDMNTLVGSTVAGLAELFGYEHSLLLLLDEDGTRLYTIASHGYDDEGVGSEVLVGEGIIGMTAARCAPTTFGNLRQMTKYSRSLRRAYEESGSLGPGVDIPVPGLAHAESRVAVPALALGQLVGVLVVESTAPLAFGPDDEAALSVIASVVAHGIEAERARAQTAEAVPRPGAGVSVAAREALPPTHVRFFAADGSTFIDGDYLIKGVAGRILWSVLGHHQRDGRVDFTNREVRLDPALELPELRHNFESRLILLKRRLDERGAPIQIEKTGRGRFRLVVDGPLRLESVRPTGG